MLVRVRGGKSALYSSGSRMAPIVVISVLKYAGSFGVVIKISGCVLSHAASDVVPHFGAPIIMKSGLFVVISSCSNCPTEGFVFCAKTLSDGNNYEKKKATRRCCNARSKPSSDPINK